VFTVKIVARPDARMIEVPLEFECELPREFEGQAVLASSGVPRKVKLKTPKDAVKISTAYRADVLLADIVRLALRGSVGDMQRVQEAAQKFVRTARDRRLDGATLTVSSNGRGKIDVSESVSSPVAVGKPAAPPPVATTTTPIGVPLVAPPARPLPPPPVPAGHAPQPTADTAVLLERIAALDRRIAQLEQALPRLRGGEDPAGRQRTEQRLEQLAERAAAAEARAARFEEQLQTAVAEQRSEEDRRSRAAAAQAELRAPLQPGDGPKTRRSTAVDAFAEGLRAELRLRTKAALDKAAPLVDRIDQAAAVVAEGALSLGVPRDAMAALQELAGQAGARQQALARIREEVDFYAAPDLPVAAMLVERLERQLPPGPAEALRTALGAAGGAQVDEAHLSAWVLRAASLAGDTAFEANRGEAADEQAHEIGPDSEPRGTVQRTTVAGVKTAEGQLVRRPRVETSERKPRAAEAPPSAPPATPSEPPLALPQAAAAEEPQPGASREVVPVLPIVDPSVVELTSVDEVKDEPEAAPPKTDLWGGQTPEAAWTAAAHAETADEDPWSQKPQGSDHG
jgi:hypothetical protein